LNRIMIKIWIQKIIEKSKFLKIRYLFRYLQLGFPSAFRSQKGQKRDTKRPQKPESATKNYESFRNVDQVKNTNNVVVNK